MTRIHPDYAHLFRGICWPVHELLMWGPWGYAQVRFGEAVVSGVEFIAAPATYRYTQSAYSLVRWTVPVVRATDFCWLGCNFLSHRNMSAET